jgi:SAM-dependent methyltransferase
MEHAVSRVVTMVSTFPRWERERHWPLMRPFVYYLVENFVPTEWIPGRRIVDFSGGLGDLTRYLAEHAPSDIRLTVPDPDLARPEDLPGVVRWRPGVRAGDIEESFEPESVDLFCARMVFQFPRWEPGRIDPDEMLRQIRSVLVPAGRLVVATHAFFSLPRYPSVRHETDVDRLLDRLIELADAAGTGEIAEAEARRIRGLVEMVRYLGLPPREGPSGETGFGLKVPMLVQSFLRTGFDLEVVQTAEPFTYPVGMWKRLEQEPEAVRSLGARVFELKRPHLVSAEARDDYSRPGTVGAMLRELEGLVEFVTVPIVRLVGRKA